LISRRAFVLCCLPTLLLGCAAQPARDPAAVYYRVQRGDTLYSIAWRYDLDYRTLASLNRMDPNTPIYPGQVLVLQSPNARAEPAGKGAPPAGSGSPAAGASGRERQEAATAAGLPRFRWATEGEVIGRFDPGRFDRQGIDIAGRRGQPVYAASDGRIVYSGNGLPDYGNLVIIKHNGTYLSAYAHNDRVHVKEGAYVKSGQRIADMGNTGTDRPKLHFQIRKNGHPVDPLKYLPKR
jgi:lipoprotein NlpD